MSDKKEANRYDKIFKENLEAVTLALVEKVLHIEVASYEKIPVDLQRTLERKPDQLLQITDTRAQTFILQLEFQLIDESDMRYRMLEYRALLARRYKLPIHQYVFFLSDQLPQMQTQIQERQLTFGFDLIQLSTIDYKLFLSSSNPDEVVFAVLANFEQEDAATVARQLIERLQATSASKLELDKHLEQLRILANLRKVKPFIEQIMESITKYIKEEEDYFFKKGEQKGEKRGREQEKKEVILKFLKDGILTTQQLSSYFEVSEEFVENLRKSLNP